MTRRSSMLHVVMSLLLLISQQMGLLHVVSHLNAPASTTVTRYSVSNAERSSDASQLQTVRDLSCEQCLAFAQLANALPFDVTIPAVSDTVRFPPLPAAPAGVLQQTIAHYQSRAPPVFS